MIPIDSLVNFNFFVCQNTLHFHDYKNGCEKINFYKKQVKFEVS